MQFPGDLQVVLSHPKDVPYVDMKKCPGRRRFALVSAEELAVYNADQAVPELAASFRLAEKTKANGLFVNMCWVDVKVIAVLSNIGKVYLFMFGEKGLTPMCIIADLNRKATAVAGYSSQLLVGYEDGSVEALQLTDDGCSTICEKQISEYSIKSIHVARSKILILVGNAQVYLADGLNSLKNGDLSSIAGGAFSKVATAEIRNMAALYDPKVETVTLTDLDKNDTLLEVKTVLSMAFSWDGSILVMLCRNEIVWWSARSRQLMHFRRAQCTNGYSVILLSNMMVVATLQGIQIFDIVQSSHANVCLLSSSSKVVEFRPTERELMSIVHSLDSFGSIDFAIADGYERFICIASSSRIGVISRRTMRIVELSHSIENIRGIEWLGERLCVTSYDFRTGQYTLNIMKLTETELKHIKTILLSSRPMAIGSDSFEYLVISLSTGVLTISKNLTSNVHIVSSPLTMVKPHTKSGLLFALNQRMQLLTVPLMSSDLAPTVIREHVFDFYISPQLSLLFVIDHTGLWISTIAETFSFIQFSALNGYPIGIEPSLFSLVVFDDNACHCLPFLEPLAISYLEDTEKCLNFLRDSGCDLVSQLTNITVTQAKNRDMDDCFALLQALPETRDTVIVHALRRLETPERQIIYDTLDNSCEMFCRLSSSKTVQNGNITVFESVDGTRNVSLAALLLPVLLEENGPTVAFPAAIFCILMSHDSSSDIKSYGRFLEPLTCPVSAESPDMVVCVGVHLNVDTYTDLKMELESALFTSFCDLLSRGQFSLLLALQKHLKAPLVTFLSDPRTAIIKSNPPVIDTSKFSSRTISHFSDLFRRQGWSSWVDSLSKKQAKA